MYDKRNKLSCQVEKEARDYINENYWEDKSKFKSRLKNSRDPFDHVW